MNKRTSLFFILFILIFSFSSCKTLFTGKMRNEFERNNIDLKKIQFFNSSRIVLIRTITKRKQSATPSGTVKYKKGKLIEEVIIRRHTPGILLKSTGDTLNICFGKNDNHYLSFSYRQGHYQLDYYGDNIKFNNIEYEIYMGKRSSLVIKKMNRKTKKIRTKYLEGRKIK